MKRGHWIRPSGPSPESGPWEELHEFLRLSWHTHWPLLHKPEVLYTHSSLSGPSSLALSAPPASLPCSDVIFVPYCSFFPSMAWFSPVTNSPWILNLQGAPLMIPPCTPCRETVSWNAYIDLYACLLSTDSCVVIKICHKSEVTPPANNNQGYHTLTEWLPGQHKGVIKITYLLITT